LTFTTENKNPGVQGPRQWLRSSPDGNAIYFYQKDDSGIIQIYAVSPVGGSIKAITANDFSPDSSFALSADGKYLAYGAHEAIYVTSVETGKTILVLPAPEKAFTHLSNINWSNEGHTIAYNRKGTLNGEGFYQIFVLDLNTFLYNNYVTFN
jgi:Tol biopolymer transport system component